MHNKNILIWGEFPPKTITGISVSNQSIRKILEKHGYIVHTEEEYSWDKNSLLKILHLLYKNIKILIKAVSKQFDIYYFTISLSWFGLLKAFLFIIPFSVFSKKSFNIAHIHRGDLKVFLFQKKIYFILFQRILKRTNRLILLSEQFKRDLKDILDHQDICVLHNTSGFEAHKSQYNYYHQRFLCISNYICSKGIMELVQTFKNEKLKTFHLDIYGHIYDLNFYQKLQNVAPDNVHLKAEVPRNEMKETMQSYDCFILPSWNEGQPIVLLEAMSLGLPIISTNVGDIPQMLGSDYSFYAEPRNVDSLEKAILRFDKIEDKKTISDYVYQRYMNNYSNEDYRRMVLEIFKPK